MAGTFEIVSVDAASQQVFIRMYVDGREEPLEQYLPLTSADEIVAAAEEAIRVFENDLRIAAESLVVPDQDVLDLIGQTFDVS